jgi:manganese/zinc/iron transport system permease protein
MDQLINYNTLIVLLGTTLLGANAGLIGSFTVLRGRALIGDVLSHASLPGLFIAFLILGYRDLRVMFVGALVSGILCILLITFLRRWTRIKDDAALGVARSTFLGLGIALSSYIQNHSHIGSAAGIDSVFFGKTAGLLAEDVELFAYISAFSLASILLLYKEFQLASFDPGFARVQGWPALLLDNAQLALAAVTVVVALPTVGAILIAALLILPGATMRFWTDRLSTLLIGAAVIGGVVGGLGTLASAEISKLPTGPIIILVGTAAFLASLLGAPRRGLLARAAADRKFRNDLRLHTLLRQLYEAAEAVPTRGSQRTSEDVRRALGWSEAQFRKVAHEAVLQQLIVRRVDDTLNLTPSGVEYAGRIVRGYRIWQRFLTEYPDQNSSLTSLDFQHIDEALPPDVVRALELKLKDEGRLPSVALTTLAAFGGNSA